MRYSLRLLLILLAIAPPLLAGSCRLLLEPVRELGDLEEEYDFIYFDSEEEYQTWNKDVDPTFRKSVIAITRQGPQYLLDLDATNVLPR